MEELIKLVSKKTGIAEEQAKVAVKTVMDFLKERLPEPLGSQLDTLLENDAAINAAEDLLDNLGGLDALSGLLGGKKK